MPRGISEQGTPHRFEAQFSHEVRLQGLATERGSHAGMTIFISFPNGNRRESITAAIRKLAADQRQWAVISETTRSSPLSVRFHCPVTFTGRDYNDLFDEFKNYLFALIDPKHVHVHWLSPIHQHQFGSRGSFGNYALFGLIQQGPRQPEVVIRAFHSP